MKTMSPDNSKTSPVATHFHFRVVTRTTISCFTKHFEPSPWTLIFERIDTRKFKLRVDMIFLLRNETRGSIKTLWWKGLGHDWQGDKRSHSLPEQPGPGLRVHDRPAEDLANTKRNQGEDWSKQKDIQRKRLSLSGSVTRFVASELSRESYEEVCWLRHPIRVWQL